ncbi:jg10459 [Pararge aegeria aegeria]|uniref:Jg10459 protein n=1 Tax=Pararge aegeria aegeria TaxID=348720 RepID=A0A8S4REP5_9NEOP|nr:jg10459 [Pararge aegeria aegeria]
MAGVMVSGIPSPINSATLHRASKEHVLQRGDMCPSIGGVGVTPHVTVIPPATTPYRCLAETIMAIVLPQTSSVYCKLFLYLSPCGDGRSECSYHHPSPARKGHCKLRVHRHCARVVDEGCCLDGEHHNNRISRFMERIHPNQQTGFDSSDKKSRKSSGTANFLNLERSFRKMEDEPPWDHTLTPAAFQGMLKEKEKDMERLAPPSKPLKWFRIDEKTSK